MQINRDGQCASQELPGSDQRGVFKGGEAGQKQRRMKPFYGTTAKKPKKVSPPPPGDRMALRASPLTWPSPPPLTL